MASQLAQTAKAVRIGMAGLVAFFFLYIVLSQLMGVVNKIIVSRQPPKSDPPTVGFGKLPKLPLRRLILEGDPPHYSLETTTGTLPAIIKKVKIFKLIQPQASFLSLEKTKAAAKKLGFTTIPQEISASLYLWQEGQRSLRANTVTGNFEVDSDISQMTLSVGDLPSPGEIKSTAKGYLDGKGLLRSGFEIGNQEVTLIKKDGSSLTKALGLSETALAKIDFFRAVRLDEETIVPILPQNPKKGLIELYYVKAGSNNYPKIKYTVWEFDWENGETYPLRPIENAWQEVKNNDGFVSYIQYQGSDSLENLNSASLVDVYIRKVYLAYFDDEDLQNYLQPIYVFEGDGKSTDGRTVDIAIYLPAVDSAWVE